MSEYTTELPDEVLEEVAKAAYYAYTGLGDGAWECEVDDLRDLYRADVRAVYPVLAAWVAAQALDAVEAELADMRARHFAEDRHAPSGTAYRDGIARAESAVRSRAAKLREAGR